jgi:hypothetical protein
MLAEARELAFPRYPGSDGDRRAIALLLRKLGGAGLEAREEPFSYDLRHALRAIRWVLRASAALVAAAGVLASRSPAAAVAALAACAAVGGWLLLWSPRAERLYARAGPTRTSNVVGLHRARSGRPRLTLILIAHHDSKSQNLVLPVRVALTLVALAAYAGLVIALGSSWLRAVAPEPAWLAPLLGCAAAIALAVLSTLRSGNRSPGGVDNAGSVAILLELARCLPARVADDVELVFLSTGAEEDHMVGAMRWLAAHRAQLEGRAAWALNFDGAGAPGKVVLLERYGALRPFSPALSRAARDGARRLGIACRGITLPPAVGIDAIPFAHHGVPCLTFSSGSLDRATLAVHSPGDVADHLDPEALARVARLAEDVALGLARDGSAGSTS